MRNDPMWPAKEQSRSRIGYALAGAAIIGAQYIASKAARDALFLTYFEPSSLPPMIIGTSIFSIVLVLLSSKGLSGVAPATYVPIAFLGSAVLLVVEWALTFTAPRLAAPVLYLQVSGIGPLLGSGFWLIASERFDPRTAKKRFGQIGGAGTLGGLVGGLVAARLAATADVVALLPLLAGLNAICAWLARSLARTPHGTAPPHAPRHPSPAPAARPERSGLRTLTHTSYLRDLALLVLVGTISAAFVDYVFKVQVKAAFSGGAELGTFFSAYYAGINLITFAIQTFASHAVLEKLGLAAAMSAPSLCFVAGGAAALAFPGLPSAVTVRAAESVCRGSLLRSGYELFFTPIAPGDKRAVKAVVDVGVDRSGDIVGAGIIQLLLWAPPSNLSRVLLWMAIVCSAAAAWVAARLNRGYVQALEQSLLNRAVELDLSDVDDHMTRTVVLKTLYRTRPGGLGPSARGADADRTQHTEQDIEAVVALRSRDVARVRAVLARTLTPPLVPFVIPMLEWDAIAPDAVRALRAVADEHVNALTDALVDPHQPFAVRRRLARVLSVSQSPRAIEGLLIGLEDLRFEVRYQSGRSLGTIRKRNPRVALDTSRVLAAVRREVGVNRRVWESRQLIDGLMDRHDERSSLEALVSERANRALEHVFTLLGLVQPVEPLQIAYRGLHTTDAGLRGTALEYLDSVLPPDVRDNLWPFLGEGVVKPSGARGKKEVLDDLLRSNQSIRINLEQQLKRGGSS